MSEEKIRKLEEKINEIVSRPSYATTPAWRQEVAELRLQIEALRSGRDVERREYQRPVIGAMTATKVTGETKDAPSIVQAIVEGEDPEPPEGPIDADELSEGEEPGQVDDAHHPNYGAVWFGLALLTLLEWKCAVWFGVHGITLWVLLALMAVVKALMVAFYFMHLAFERRVVHALLTVPLILVVILMALLIPDARQQIYDYLAFLR